MNASALIRALLTSFRVPPQLRLLLLQPLCIGSLTIGQIHNHSIQTSEAILYPPLQLSIALECFVNDI